jgi:hypothetical protein
LEYVDDQYEWRILNKGNIQVHWVGDDPAVAQVVLDSALKALPKLRTMIPFLMPSRIRIYVYPSLAELQAGLRLTGREWIGAHAHPELGVILVAAANPRTATVDLDNEIAHELSHLLLFQYAGIGESDIPLWFDEGLATVLEPSSNGNFDSLVQRAIEEQRTIPLPELCRSFPIDEELLAYAESASVIRYIQAQYGNGAVSQMVFALADGADCRSMVQRTLGLNLEELYEEWLANQENQSTLTRAWQRGGLWLILLAGFVIAGVLFVGLAKTQKKNKADQI